MRLRLKCNTIGTTCTIFSIIIVKFISSCIVCTSSCTHIFPFIHIISIQFHVLWQTIWSTSGAILLARHQLFDTSPHGIATL